MSLISDEENRIDEILCRSVELDKLDSEWSNLNWNKITRSIFKIQKRIFHAEDQKNYREVRSQSRLLLNNNDALLYSIRIVTQLNSGKRTAGVDSEVVLTNAQRMELFYKLKDYNINSHKPKPVSRVLIPKKHGKTRPLGIPTIIDRVFQMLAKLALEPVWECHFEHNSYGFRPTRGQQDAIAKIHSHLRGLKRPWIFEGDFKSCFDTLDHGYINEQIKHFPASETIKRWLKAGYIFNDEFNETRSGTPQGGIISPLLANIALHGMEEALNIKYNCTRLKDGRITYTNKSKYVMVRYADDFVVLCKTKEDAQKVPDLLRNYLKERGLTLAPDKTYITQLKDGFDFLGITIRDFGGKVLTKPSKDSIKSFKDKVRKIFNKALGMDMKDFILTLNDLVRGTALYWRMTAAKETFHNMDEFLNHRIQRLLDRLYPDKSETWVEAKHYKPDRNSKRFDNYILTDPKSGVQALRMGWVRIKYARCIRYKATPFDSTCNSYYERFKFRNAYDCLYKKRISNMEDLYF